MNQLHDDQIVMVRAVQNVDLSWTVAVERRAAALETWKHAGEAEALKDAAFWLGIAAQQMNEAAARAVAAEQREADFRETAGRG